MKFTRSITGMVLAVVLTFSSLTVTAFAAGDIMYGIGFVNTNALRMRSTPSTEGNVQNIQIILMHIAFLKIIVDLVPLAGFADDRYTIILGRSIQNIALC